MINSRTIDAEIYLDSMDDTHIQHLIRLAQDPILPDIMGWDTWFNEYETSAFINAISLFAFPYSRASKPIVFGIYVQSLAQPIGYVVLKGLNMEVCTAEIGIAILDQKYWHKGIGGCALDLILDYAVRELQLQTLAAAVLVTNQRSIRLFQRMGFKIRETWYQSWPMPNGELADMLWLEWANQA